MSIRALRHVWDHAKVTGDTFMVLLALADHADDEGYGSLNDADGSWECIEVPLERLHALRPPNNAFSMAVAAAYFRAFGSKRHSRLRPFLLDEAADRFALSGGKVEKAIAWLVKHGFILEAEL